MRQRYADKALDKIANPNLRVKQDKWGLAKEDYKQLNEKAPKEVDPSKVIKESFNDTLNSRRAKS